MADVLLFHLTGMDGILERLDALPKKLKKKAAKVAARKGMNIVRDEARRNAKKIDNPESRAAIWKNIRTQEATRSGRKVGGVVMRVGVVGGGRIRKISRKQREAQSANLPGGATQHWWLIEFGSENTKARPFMRPALASKIDAVEEKVASELSAAIDRLADSPAGAS